MGHSRALTDSDNSAVAAGEPCPYSSRIVRPVTVPRHSRLSPLLVSVMALSACGQAVQTEPPRPVLRYVTYAGSTVFPAELTARLRSALPDMEIAPESAAGSFAVVSALQEGRADFGFATADVVYLAYRRGTEASPEPHANLRAIAVRWVNAMHIIVPRDSRIATVPDLKGHRLGVHPVGSSAELFTRIVLEAHGLAYADVRPTFATSDRITEAFRSGAVEAAMIESGPMRESVRTPQSRDVRVLPIHSQVINTIRNRYPFVKPVAVTDASGVNVETIGVDSVLICRKDLSEEVVYRLTRELVALLAETARIRNVGTRLNPSHAPATPIPLHPGAARYHREREILH